MGCSPSAVSVPQCGLPMTAVRQDCTSLAWSISFQEHISSHMTTQLSLPLPASLPLSPTFSAASLSYIFLSRGSTPAGVLPHNGSFTMVSELARAPASGLVQAIASSRAGHLQTPAAQTLPRCASCFRDKFAFHSPRCRKDGDLKNFDFWKFTWHMKCLNAEGTTNPSGMDLTREFFVCMSLHWHEKEVLCSQGYGSALSWYVRCTLLNVVWCAGPNWDPGLLCHSCLQFHRKMLSQVVPFPPADCNPQLQRFFSLAAFI